MDEKTIAQVISFAKDVQLTEWSEFWRNSWRHVTAAEAADAAAYPPPMGDDEYTNERYHEWYHAHVGRMLEAAASVILAEPAAQREVAWAAGISGVKLTPELEAFIGSDADAAYFYASHRGEAFPVGEAAIAANPATALDYTVNVVRRRWTPGEPAILAHQECRDKFLAWVYWKGAQAVSPGSYWLGEFA